MGPRPDSPRPARAPLARAGALLALLAVAIAAAPRSAAAVPLEPIADCVEPSEAAPGYLRYELGYNNQNLNSVSLPVGPENFFSPPPNFRGQPEAFLPGLHHNSFGVLADPDESFAWNLEGSMVTLGPETPQCAGAGFFWRGAWEATRQYLSGDVVAEAGSSWIAESASLGVRPGGTAEWGLLAAAGAAGPKGEAGARGPAGPPGPASGAALGGPHRFSRAGRARVRDPRVDAGSFVLVQYADRRRHDALRATNLVRVFDGGFVVRGEPRARFRYALLGPG